jgi:hypothetical protein
MKLSVKALATLRDAANYITKLRPRCFAANVIEIGHGSP